MIEKGSPLGYSRNKALVSIVGLRDGWVDSSPANIAAMKAGKPFAVVMSYDKARSQPRRGLGARHRSAFFAAADDEIGRPLRRLSKLAPDDADALWLGLMTISWRLALDGAPGMEPIAREIAGWAGESAFFRDVMAPLWSGRNPVAIIRAATDGKQTKKRRSAREFVPHPQTANPCSPKLAKRKARCAS